MAVRTVLDLDLARRTGWAVGPVGARPRAGAVQLEGASHGAVYMALIGWLDDFLAVHGFGEVVCEAPLVSGDFSSQNAAEMALGLAAHVASWCFDNGVSYARVHVQTARKDVLGRGTFAKGMSKAAVLAWAREQGFTPATDDAADALVVWAHATGWHRQPALLSGAKVTA